MRRVNFGGKVHEFPDDATDQEISEALGGKMQGTPGAFFATNQTRSPEQVKSAHPWMQLNAAARSGQMPKPGQDYPGAGRIPTLGEAAADTAGLGATIAAAPVAAAVAPGMPILGPMIGRTLAGGVPGVLKGDMSEAGQGVASQGIMEALASIVGAPFAGFRRLNTPRPAGPPAVHQAVNPAPAPGAPIIVNRVPGSTGATVHGGGSASMTPNQITVQPPTSGSWVNAPGQPASPNPAVIVQESLPPAPRPLHPPTIGNDARVLADTFGRDNPDEAMTGGAATVAALQALRHILPFGYGGHAPMPPAP